jgi:PAP2 superfamily
MRLVHHRRAVVPLSLVLSITALGVGAPSGVPRAAAADPGSVSYWSDLSVRSVTVGRPAGSGLYLHAIVTIAIHDAVAAIDGGDDALISSPTVTLPADTDAAVAAAARGVLVVRLWERPAQIAQVEAAYASYLAAISDGEAKTNGTAAGEAVAADVLADRADDRFDAVVPYVQPAPGPGVFEPVAPTTPVDTKLGQVVPIALPVGDDDKVEDSFLPGPPVPLTSAEYAADFAEVKALGRATDSSRTPEQTETAWFWSENTPIQYERTLRQLALQRGLGRMQTARLFAIAFVPAADSLIVCLAAKYRYLFWRPIHAIQKAETDGNPLTEPDTQWRALLTVNHPEYPSGHSCATGAVVPALEAYFGTSRVPVSVSSTITNTTRTYPSFDALGRDVFAARIYGGLHFRFSMGVGFNLAKHVSRYVLENYF